MSTSTASNPLTKLAAAIAATTAKPSLRPLTSPVETATMATTPTATSLESIVASSTSRLFTTAGKAMLSAPTPTAFRTAQVDGLVGTTTMASDSSEVSAVSDAIRNVAAFSTQARFIIDELFVPLNEEECRMHMRVDNKVGKLSSRFSIGCNYDW